MAERPIDIIAVAGTRRAGARRIHEQMDAAAGALSNAAIHVVAAGDQTWAEGVAAARQRRARRLLIVGDELEHTLRDGAGIERLERLRAQCGGRCVVVALFQHQSEHLNQVFAERAVLGEHEDWFEDFVRRNVASPEFDLASSVVGLERTEHIEVVGVGPEALVERNGLGAITAAADLHVSLRDLPTFERDAVPDATAVDTALMTSRLRRFRDSDPAPERRSATIAAVASAARTVEHRRGGFWGWTTELLAEFDEQLHRQNLRLHELTGVWLSPRPGRNPVRLVMRDAPPTEMVDLLHGLDVSTRPAPL